MRQTKQLSISKTKGEWELINKIVSDSGKKNLNDFLKCEVVKLKKQYDDCPQCITKANGRKVEKRPYLPISIYCHLEILALKMKIPESAVVDKLIIQPLLNSKD